MTKTMAISEAREKLLELPAELAKQSCVVAITRRGEKILAILPWDVYEALEETIEIMGDRELMSSLRKSLDEAKKGKTIPWKRVKAEMGI